MRYKILANAVMLIHFAWIALLVGGTIFILDGTHRWYIPAHLVIISGTLLLNLFLGFCPLTLWEEKLRKKYDGSADLHNNFMATYIHSLLGVRVGKGLVFWLTFFVKLTSYAVSVLLLTIFK